MPADPSSNASQGLFESAVNWIAKYRLVPSFLVQISAVPCGSMGMFV